MILEKVSELIARIPASHFHILKAVLIVADQYRASFMLRISRAGPANATAVIQIIFLFSKGKLFARPDQQIQFIYLWHEYLMILSVPPLVKIMPGIQIRIEYTGISLFPKQDQRIGNRLKPGIHRCFQ